MNILKFNHNTPYVCFKTAKTSDRTKENFPNTAIHFPNSKNATIPEQSETKDAIGKDI